MNLMRASILLCVLGVIASACGSSGLKGSDGSNAEVGAISASILGSKSFNPNISHGTIVKYVVTLSGEKLAEPLVIEVASESEGATFNELAPGQYDLRAEAINENGAIIRDGGSAALKVDAGNMTDVEIQMEAVPIFANISNGAVISNTRLIPTIFAGAPDPVELEDEFGGVALPLMDVSSGEIEIYPDASSGMATVNCGLLAAGVHKFRVKNILSGRQSEVAVTVLDGTKMRGAPLFSGGSSSSTVGGIQ